MKRKLAGLLAALLVLSMGTTVYAAESPTAEDIEAAAAGVTVNATDSNGNNIQIDQTSMSAEDYSRTLDKVETMGKSTELLGAVELNVPDGYNIGDSITVTLSLNEIKSTDGTDNIRVLHYNGSAWETITPNAVSAGKVTVTLTSLSPVAVVRTADTSSESAVSSTSTTSSTTNTSSTEATKTGGSNTNTNTSNTGSSSSGGNTQTNNNYQTVNVYTTGNGTSASAQPSASTSTTSPKTGASLPALPILAVLAAMGIAVCGKKARSLS